MSSSQILGLIITILLTGFFAGIEAAFLSANKLSIELRKKRGTGAGQILSRFMEYPSRLIGASRAGVNIMLVIYGVLVASSLQFFWQHLLGGALDNAYLKVFVEALLSALLILILGRFFPIITFRLRADSLLTFFAFPIAFFSWLLYPVASALVGTSEWILKYLFNMRISDKKQVFPRLDLENFIHQTQQYGAENQELNTELFENALDIVHVKIRDCMVPRKEVESLEINTSMKVVMEKFKITKLSKIIIYEKNIDNIQGYIHQLDMFKNPVDIRSVLHPILAVPETMSATDLIGKFTKERKTIAWVVDEFGGTAGIVSMEDVLEEIFGEIQDEYDTEEFVEKQVAENEYIFSGRLEIDYLNEKYNFNLPKNESETLSGFIISHYETIPKLKERIIIDDFEFDVLSVTETRIETVKMKLLK